MGVGTGSGNSISFSTIRDFYGDTNPVSLSEFNRSSNNSGLVDSTFVGASTATTGTSSQTVDDFAVTVTEVDGPLVELTNSGPNQANAPFPINASSGSLTLLNTTSFVSVVVSGNGSATYFINGSEIGSVSVDFTQGGAGFIIKGPQFNTGDRLSTSVNTVFSAGDVFSFGTNGCSTGTNTHGVRAVQYDITFQNNSSTGDTYNLTSNSTRLDSTNASQLVYAAGTSRQVKNNSSSNQFLLAYDNVTGSGSGTAGDIGVTVASGSGIAASTTVNGATNTATVTAPSSAFSYVNVTLTSTNQDPSGNLNVTAVITRNGVQVASSFSTEGLATATYSGTIAANDVFTGSGASNSGNNALTINFKNPDKVITYQNNGSSSITLGSSSTGGPRTIVAGASVAVQPGGSTNNEDWEVHFNTGSGDCNVGIPTTIGVGNPVNMDLFNTVTTPIG